MTKSGKCTADKHTKNRNVKTVVLVFVIFTVLAVLVALCFNQSRALRLLEHRTTSVEERQQRLVDVVQLLRQGGNNSTASQGLTEYRVEAGTPDDATGNQELKAHLPRAVRRRRSHRRRSLATDEGKKNKTKGKKKMYGASFVLNPKSSDCKFEGSMLIPMPFGRTSGGSKSRQIMCWTNATGVKQSPWVTTQGGIISIERKGYYHISPTLSLQLKDNSCVDKPDQAANVGFAVYKKGRHHEFGQEQQIMRCVTGLRCDSREIWTCTSGRVVHLRPDDKLWVRIEGSLKHLARVWFEPAYTSLTIVKM